MKVLDLVCFQIYSDLLFSDRAIVRSHNKMFVYSKHIAQKLFRKTFGDCFTAVTVEDVSIYAFKVPKTFLERIEKKEGHG